MKTLLVRTPDQWRAWLAEHHASASEIWLVFHKQRTGVASIDYQAALDEALCFGWVDSLIKRIDERRFARKFTPRRADSRWSAVNRKRYAELAAIGRLRAPGKQRPPTELGSAPRPARRELPAKLPQYIRAALTKDRIAKLHFDALPREQRRRYYAWIESAKREETRLRRLEESLRLLRVGRVLGLK
jgi:uncharacterized protein YdeI (YjbR/CyaY-like superfamily)